jgi:hypothetical protein
MYRGLDAGKRREQISQWAPADFQLVEVNPSLGWGRAIQAVRDKTDIYILWSDDDKPVGPDFLREMTQPLISGENFGAAMHFWSGNAVSVLKTVFEDAAIDDTEPGSQSLLKIIVQMLDTVDQGPNGRVHIALSSTERLAPLSMEATGYPC